MNVAVRMSFDAAHILGGYPGKCGNLHGHTYKLEVVVSGEASIQSMGMVLDYNDLKPIVREVADQYDHAFIVGNTIIDRSIFNLLKDENLKVKQLKGDYSTTETIATNIFSELKKKLPETVRLEKVRLAETDSTYAEVFSDGN